MDGQPAPREQDPRAGGAAAGTETVALLFGLVERMRRHLGQVAADYDLTPQQALTLQRLGERGRPMRELAELLHCDASNITGIAGRLESAGLVARETGTADRRVREMVPTDEGRRVRAELEHRLSALPPSIATLPPADQATLNALLRRLLSPAADPPGADGS